MRTILKYVRARNFCLYVRTYVYKNHWQKKRDKDIGGIHALGESPPDLQTHSRDYYLIIRKEKDMMRNEG